MNSDPDHEFLFSSDSNPTILGSADTDPRQNQTVLIMPSHNKKNILNLNFPICRRVRFLVGWVTVALG